VSEANPAGTTIAGTFTRNVFTSGTPH
jgi:hypothetical protein